MYMKIGMDNYGHDQQGNNFPDAKKDILYIYLYVLLMYFDLYMLIYTHE
jgi:hypothetical protein